MCLTAPWVLTRDANNDVTIDLKEGQVVESGYFGNAQCVCEFPVLGKMSNGTVIEGRYLDYPVRALIGSQCAMCWCPLMKNPNARYSCSIQKRRTASGVLAKGYVGGRQRGMSVVVCSKLISSVLHVQLTIRKLEGDPETLLMVTVYRSQSIQCTLLAQHRGVPLTCSDPTKDSSTAMRPSDIGGGAAEQAWYVGAANYLCHLIYNQTQGRVFPLPPTTSSSTTTTTAPPTTSSSTAPTSSTTPAPTSSSSTPGGIRNLSTGWQALRIAQLRESERSCLIFLCGADTAYGAPRAETDHLLLKHIHSSRHEV